MKKLSIFLVFLFLFTGCTVVEKEIDKKSQKPEEKVEIQDTKASIHFIDVGQGDSTLIMLPQGKTALIDAGDNQHGEEVVSYIKSKGIKKIDFLVGTHPDADHIGGLDDVINSLEVGEFYMPKKSHTTKTFRDVLKAAKNNGLKIKEAKQGVIIYEETGNKMEFLGPNGEYGDDNNLYSAVTMLTLGEKKVLMMGDAEFQNEEDMILSNLDLKADILKAGHHGSHSSTSEEFLKEVSPNAVVVSAGFKNKYGHPHREILSLLKKYDIPLYRTDEDSTIIFNWDGNHLWTDKKPGTYDYYGDVK